MQATTRKSKSIFRYLRVFVFICLAALVFAQYGVASSKSSEKVVFHLIDSQNVGLLIASLNVYVEQFDGKGGLDVVVVAHGPAVSKLVNLPGRKPAYQEDVRALQSKGVEFEACAFMMRSMDLKPTTLLPNVRFLPDGGLARVMELQKMGYSYVRM